MILILKVFLKKKLKMIRTQTLYGALSRIWVCRPKKVMALQVILVSELMVNCVLKNISVAVKFNSFYTCTTVASKLVESQPERV